MVNKKEKPFPCPYCGSTDTVKKGYSRTGFTGSYKEPVRKRECRTCGKRFQDEYISGQKKTKIVVLADTHCGHMYGLTPPDWFTSNKKHKHAKAFQKESWEWYVRAMDACRDADICIANGDLIDGRGEKSGGVELLTTDREEQAEIASECLNQIKAKKIYIARGTDYHVGKAEQFENLIAKEVEAEWIGDELNLDVNGCIINAKHHVGRSDIPHGRYNALARTALWKDLMAESVDERPNIIIRSHVHYHSFCGFSNNTLSLTTPALCGSSRYGAKRFDSTTHFGITVIEIDKWGLFKWKVITGELESLKPEILKP